MRDPSANKDRDRFKKSDAAEKTQSAGLASYQKALEAKSRIRYTGFIAQEVQEAMTASDFAFSGLMKPAHDQDHYSLRYAEFVVPLVKGMQELAEQVDGQQDVIETQEMQIAALRSEVAALKTMVRQLLANEPKPTPEQQLNLNRPAALSQNRPNPFHETTVIDYFLPEGSGNARLEVYRMDGQLLTTLSLAQHGAGQVQLRAGSFPTGTYLYSLVWTAR